jgi:hypothetical protein
MTNISDTAATTPADRRWLLYTRLLAAAPIVAVFGLTLWVHMPASGGVCAEDVSFFATAVFWLITPPFFRSLGHLLRKSAIGRKKGLAWAVVAGSFWGVVGLSLGLMDLFGGPSREAWQPVLVGLLPIALVASAIKFQYAHESPDATGKITAYTLSATPTQPACTRWKRPLTDQTGTIRVTTEDRSATVNDPPL